MAVHVSTDAVIRGSGRECRGALEEKEVDPASYFFKNPSSVSLQKAQIVNAKTRPYPLKTSPPPPMHSTKQPSSIFTLSHNLSLSADMIKGLPFGKVTATISSPFYARLSADF